MNDLPPPAIPSSPARSYSQAVSAPIVETVEDGIPVADSSFSSDTAVDRRRSRRNRKKVKNYEPDMGSANQPYKYADDANHNIFMQTADII